MDTLLEYFIERVQRTYFSNFPVYRTPEGRYAGVFMKHYLLTRFDEIGPGCACAGLECLSPGGQTLSIEALQRLCGPIQSTMVLDRFVRSIHLLNFMAQEHPWHTLFLPVTQALIVGANAEHGMVFRAILQRLELEKFQFGIVLPATLRQDHALFSRVCAAYRQHGFLLAEQQSGSCQPKLIALLNS